MSKKSTKKRANRAKAQKKQRAKSSPESILPPKPKPKTEPESVPQPAQLIDLDEEPVAEPLENLEKAPRMSLKLHALNVRLPWLKVVALVLVAALLVVGVEEVWRHNVNPPATVQVDSAPGELPAVTEAPTGVELAANTTTPEPESSKTEEPKPEVPKTESPATATESKPSAQPSTGRKLIALTFDDGPSSAQTPRLLQILKEKDAKATFFVLGNMAQKSPGVVRQAEADGHEVESHTMTHANLKRSTVEGIKWEVAAINGVFTEILGHKPNLTRPPYGNISNDVRTYVNQPLILWTVDPEDWKYKDAAAVRNKVVNGAFDGAIILMHDIYATTVDAVPGIIDDLKAAGYEFMTISELAAARGVQLQNGVTYGSFRP